jgi:hypothetical protein
MGNISSGRSAASRRKAVDPFDDWGLIKRSRLVFKAGLAIQRLSF